LVYVMHFLSHDLGVKCLGKKFIGKWIHITLYFSTTKLGINLKNDTLLSLEVIVLEGEDNKVKFSNKQSD